MNFEAMSDKAVLGELGRRVQGDQDTFEKDVVAATSVGLLFEDHTALAREDKPPIDIVTGRERIRAIPLQPLDRLIVAIVADEHGIRIP